MAHQFTAGQKVTLELTAEEHFNENRFIDATIISVNNTSIVIQEDNHHAIISIANIKDVHPYSPAFSPNDIVEKLTFLRKQKEIVEHFIPKTLFPQHQPLHPSQELIDAKNQTTAAINALIEELNAPNNSEHKLFAIHINNAIANIDKQIQFILNTGCITQTIGNAIIVPRDTIDAIKPKGLGDLVAKGSDGIVSIIPSMGIGTMQMSPLAIKNIEIGMFINISSPTSLSGLHLIIASNKSGNEFIEFITPKVISPEPLDQVQHFSNVHFQIYKSFSLQNELDTIKDNQTKTLLLYLVEKAEQELNSQIIKYNAHKQQIDYLNLYISSKTSYQEQTCFKVFVKLKNDILQSINTYLAELNDNIADIIELKTKVNSDTSTPNQAEFDTLLRLSQIRARINDDDTSLHNAILKFTDSSNTLKAKLSK